MKKKLILSCMAFCAVLSAGNLLPNSSFELGISSWGIRTVIPKQDGEYKAVKPRFRNDCVHGSSALLLSNPNGYTVQLSSVGIPVKAGKYTFSLHMKGSDDFSVSLQFFSAQKNVWHCPAKKVNVSKSWKRFVFTGQIPKGCHETVVRVQFDRKADLFLDALQFESGEISAEYQPAADIEAALLMPKTWNIPGRHPVDFLAVRYTGKAGKTAFLLQAENRKTGWKREIRRTLDLPVGKTVHEKVMFQLDNRGFIELGGRWSGGKVFPFHLAVLNPVPAGPFTPEQGFCVGVNETGVFRNAGTDHTPYQGIGIDFSEHLAMLHATGCSLIRLFENELIYPHIMNPERGKFDFSSSSPYLNVLMKSGLVPYLCIDSGAFSYAPHSKNPKQIRKNRWFMVKDAEKGTKNPLKSITAYPQMDDWKAYAGAIAENCKGKIRYYEIINEPNLRLTDPVRYTRYLKTAYQEIKKADPENRVIGICATEDHGADGGNYTRKCAEAGAFKYLDIISFHPYGSALDNSEIPARSLLDGLKTLREQYRPGVPLWNTELFYILSIRDHQKYRKTDPKYLRPENLIRRYLIDFGEGVQASTPLHVWQLFEKTCVHQEADQTWFGHKAVPGNAAVAQSAFAALMRGAKPDGRLELPEGLNGYLAIGRDGKETAAVWALENSRKFFLSVPKGIRTLDLYGNPIDCTSNHLLDECPVYLIGKNMKHVLKKKIKFLPHEKITVTGSRFRKPGLLAVEFRNRMNKDIAVTARLYKGTEILKHNIEANSSAVLHFRTDDPKPELMWIVGDQQENRMLDPVEARKTLCSGEVGKVGNALEFSAKMIQESLTISFSVKDRKRGERIRNQPWTGDCLELFFDTAPESNLNSQSLGSTVYRLFLVPPSANGLPAELSGSPNLNTEKIRWDLKEDGANYSGKIEIPWKEIGCSGPRELGFDIIADDTEGSKRTACHAWAGDDKNYSSRFKFGRLFPK